MFGSLFRLRPRPGQEDAVVDMVSEWVASRGAVVSSFIGLYLLHSRTTPGELIGLTIFDSEAAYLRNAADPTQDRWYLGLRALLEADPVWEDGDIDAFLPASEAPGT